MGMYDTIIIPDKWLPDDPGYRGLGKRAWQTKDILCALSLFRIDDDGILSTASHEVFPIDWEKYNGEIEAHSYENNKWLQIRIVIESGKLIRISKYHDN